MNCYETKSPSAVDIGICRANDVASHDDVSFSKLKSFANHHPYTFKRILEAYKKSPDFRFGDTLLIFCDSIKNRRIKLKPQPAKIVGV